MLSSRGRDCSALIRGFGFSAGLYRIFGLRFALAFGTLITVGQAFGTGAACVLPPTTRPRAGHGSRGAYSFWGTIVRVAGYMSYRAHLQHAAAPYRPRVGIAVCVGLITGITTGVGIVVTPLRTTPTTFPSAASAASASPSSFVDLLGRRFSIQWRCWMCG